MIQGLDHIGIIVRDLDQAMTQYQSYLGLPTVRVEDYGQGLLRIAFIPLGLSPEGVPIPKIELLQPLRPGSSAWQFLEQKGEGIEHLAFIVEKLDDQLKRLQSQDVPLWDVSSRPGADGTRIAFLDPKGLSGCLVELVESGKE